MTLTTFDLLCRLCGLSLREAADHLGVRPDTAKSWSSGRREAPAAILQELRNLARKIEIAAERELTSVLAQKAAELILSYIEDDAMATAWGLPCIGAHAAMLARVVVALPQDAKIIYKAAEVAGEMRRGRPWRVI
jgi:hypothetical protein